MTMQDTRADREQDKFVEVAGETAVRVSIAGGGGGGITQAETTQAVDDGLNTTEEILNANRMNSLVYHDVAVPGDGYEYYFYCRVDDSARWLVKRLDASQSMRYASSQNNISTPDLVSALSSFQSLNYDFSYNVSGGF